MVYRINPKVRAYGKARLDITIRARNEAEWLQGWHDALYDFPFQLSSGWCFGFEYKVDDFAAEIGFFLDQLGFPVDSFSPSYARFTTPNQDFIFSVAQTLDGEMSTPPETVRLQLQVVNLDSTVRELESRGIEFEQEPIFLDSRSSMVATFRSPHGVSIDLWEHIDQAEFNYQDDDYDELDDEGADIQSESNFEVHNSATIEDTYPEDDSDLIEDPGEELFEESKQKNYRLWDEDEEQYDPLDVDDQEEAGLPLVMKVSANKDEFLDRLLKETSDRDVEEQSEEVSNRKGRTQDKISRPAQTLSNTRSVLRNLRENQSKSFRKTISAPKITSQGSSFDYRNTHRVDENHEDEIADELSSEEELIYQEIDDTELEFPE